MDIEEKMERRKMLERLMRRAEKIGDSEMILRLCDEFNDLSK